MVTTSKIIKKILRSFDDKVLSIKIEMFRVDTQNSYYELTIDSEETTKHVFITINGRLKMHVCCAMRCGTAFTLKCQAIKRPFLLLLILQK